jgi:hypothetical protein
MARFVVQEHKATNLYWDLRLDGRYALIRTDGKNWLRHRTR